MHMYCITDIHFWIKSHVLYTVVYKWIKDKPLKNPSNVHEHGS